MIFLILSSTSFLFHNYVLPGPSVGFPNGDMRFPVMGGVGFMLSFDTFFRSVFIELVQTNF